MEEKYTNKLVELVNQGTPYIDIYGVLTEMGYQNTWRGFLIDVGKEIEGVETK